MAEDADQATELPPEPMLSGPGPRRRLVWWALALVALSALALLAGWLNRKDIADRLIVSQLQSLGLPATYRIETIGADKQVLRDVVIGDPRRPDLTVERVEVAMESNWGVPGFGRITLERPRLYGSYSGGRLSFGSLDKVLFTGSKEPFRLPDLDLALRDGRARIGTDFGPVGVKLEGAGELRGGFSGMLAAIAPKAATKACRAENVRLYGQISVNRERPRFIGPLRLARLECREQGLLLAESAAELDARLDPRIDGGEGRLRLRGGALSLAGGMLGQSGGTVRATWRKGDLAAHYSLTASALKFPQASAASFALEGAVRAPQSLSAVEVSGTAKGNGIGLGPQLDTALAGLQRSGAGTLAEPLAARIRAALLREGRQSRFSATYILRRTGGRTDLSIPGAALTGGSGQVLATLTRLRFAADGLSGAFSTGGDGLPRIAGRLEMVSGRLTARFAMADYAAGKSRVALPQLVLVEGPGGAYGLAGQARVSGALPGGEVSNLVLPISGNWSASAGLSLWRKCTPLRFDRLMLANFSLERRAITLCPPTGGGAILRSGPKGTRIAAGAPSLDLAGRLGATPLRIRSGPIGFAVPGNLSARALDIELGPRATASRFRIANLSARIGKDVAGTFAGSDIRLATVPLDMLDAAGKWRFAAGKLAIEGASLRLEDRQVDDRFQPLVAQGASLSLENNRILAQALLREPGSGREVVRTVIRHDLATGRGDAALAVEGITFDKGLQPDTLSRLALGVIAQAQGTVRGGGRIAWTPDTLTSTGSFTTDSLDFAAAFGPVDGLSGTVNFTDLIGMVTAPDQRLRIASINPGIEVTEGELSFQMKPDLLLEVNGATWPFMGGTLTLQPTRMVMGAAETRRFTLMVEGLNAGLFVQRMEMGNMNAIGVFDGKLPLVFDERGGRIEGGVLLSRPPGGNVAYVGELTYKDLSAMGNFAFAALRSVDYRQMQIEMNGAIDGEIITRISFDGLSQGAGTSRNYLTRQVEKLPIRFNVNLRAPFVGLMTTFRSMYDPSYVMDPRLLGLIGPDGKPLRPEDRPPPRIPLSDIQPPASEPTP